MCCFAIGQVDIVVSICIPVGVWEQASWRVREDNYRVATVDMVLALQVIV